jgi:PEP-CTERM motif
MNLKKFVLATLVCVVAAPAFAAPVFNAMPNGVQAGNWKWTVEITPDLSLVPDNSGTPVALEFGFRLTGGQLLSATIADPIAFDTPNPGKKIFGWEPSDPFLGNQYSFGLQTNLVTSEIFTAFGSMNFTTPGPKQFITILTSGPSVGANSSTIQWLGVYGPGANQGLISQVNGLNGTVYTTGNYFFGGFATQAIPEPASAAMLLVGTAVATLTVRRRRSAR